METYALPRRGPFSLRLAILGAAFLLAAFVAGPQPASAVSFAVDTTADDPGITLQGCAGAAGDCSLRGAITRANLNTQADAITFSVSGTISIASALPGLTGGGDTIDGTGASLLIQGAETQTFPCVVISSAGNTVKGLTITDCSHGVELDSTTSDNNTIGPANAIFDTHDGIYVTSASATGNTIMGNKLGTNIAATAIPPEGGNINGVTVFGAGNTVGGPAVADRNVISGNGNGIWLTGTGNQVYGNYVGTDLTGTVDLGNETGVEVSAGGSSNNIGGILAGQGNLISGNDISNVYLTGLSGGGTNNNVQGNIIGPTITGGGTLTNGDGVDLVRGASGNVIGPGNVISDNIDGVWAAVSGTSGNVIKGNLIGTNPDGTAALPNSSDGIDIESSAGPNSIGGANPGDSNVIAFNGANGVRVDGAATLGNTIRANSIHSNGNVGIFNLNGGNGGLAPPTVDAAGSASGTACGSCVVDVFSDDGNQGRVYHGSTVALAGGTWNFGGAVTGPYVTATATNGAGNTSMFSPLPFCLDSDGDSTCNAFDTDDDNDGYTDVAEGGVPLCANGINEDAFDVGGTDVVADDGCPGGPTKVGDFSEAQFNIGTNPLDPCGNDGWPSDLDSAGLSANELDISDIVSFITSGPPGFVRRLDSSPTTTVVIYPRYNARWDLSPGPAPFTNWINIVDITTLLSGPAGSPAYPPMFGGLRAFGRVCPLAP